MLEIFLDALVAGIVGNHQQKAVVGLDGFAALFDRQDAPMVGQRMDEDGSVLARFDDFVEVADGAAADGLRERPVNPYGFIRLDQEAADQIAAGEVLMASDGDKFVGAVFERRQ